MRRDWLVSVISLIAPCCITPNDPLLRDTSLQCPAEVPVSFVGFPVYPHAGQGPIVVNAQMVRLFIIRATHLVSVKSPLEPWEISKTVITKEIGRPKGGGDKTQKLMFFPWLYLQ